MLEAREPVVLPALGGGVRLRLAPARAMVSVAAFAGQAARLGEALRVALPAAPVRVQAADVTWLWSGVESWLAVADDVRLAARFAGLDGLAAVVDQSHGRVVLEVTGPQAAAALAKLVPIDLYPGAFGEQATALTLAGGIGVQIWRVEDGFALACFASYARALAAAVAQAGRDYE